MTENARGSHPVTHARAMGHGSTMLAQAGWYPIVGRGSHTFDLAVDGQVVTVPECSVELAIRGRRYAVVTSLPAPAPGAPVVRVVVCPEGHHMFNVGPDAYRAMCERCKGSYEIGDEPAAANPGAR